MSDFTRSQWLRATWNGNTHVMLIWEAGTALGTVTLGSGPGWGGFGTWAVPQEHLRTFLFSFFLLISYYSSVSCVLGVKSACLAPQLLSTLLISWDTAHSKFNKNPRQKPGPSTATFICLLKQNKWNYPCSFLILQVCYRNIYKELRKCIAHMFPTEWNCACASLI